MFAIISKTGSVNAGDVLRFIRHSKGADVLEPIIPFAAKLPAFSGNILELHFSKKENWIDFAPRISRDFDQGMISNGTINLPFLEEDPTVLFNSNTWQHYTQVSNIWIEYDAPFQDKPALFFDIDSGLDYSPLSAQEKLLSLAEYFSLNLQGRILPFLEKIAALNLHVVYYGFMFSRRSDSVRLTVNGIKAESILSVLKELGWNGNYAGLENLQRHYLRNDQRLVLGVDVGDDLQPRIGLEVFDKNANEFGESLLRDGYLIPNHFHIIQNWPQTIELEASLAERLSVLHKRQINEVYTRFNHFKFILDASNAVLAKGYLYYCF